MSEPTVPPSQPVSSISTTSPLLIALAWLVVILPAAWGLKYTTQNALKIFDRPPSASAAPASASPR